MNLKKLLLLADGLNAALTVRRRRLANEMEAAEGLLGMANEFKDGEWIQLAPIGDFPHERGIQRVDASAVQAMANQFNGLLQSAKRKLFGGVPFYVGHPDVPQLANEYPDKKAYGWVKALEARADGLYGQVEWSEPGKTLLANKHYKFFSPYWDARTAGSEKGRTVYQPVALLSVGLTNQPNLPVKPLANARTENGNNNGTEMQLAQLIALLGLANTATEQDATNEINRIKTEAGKVTGLANEKNTAATALENERTAHTTAKTALENARSQRNKLVLDAAVKAGKITAAQRGETETALNADFDATVTKLENVQAVVKTQSRLANQGKRRATLSGDEDAIKARRAKVTALVNEKMKGGMIYDEAYNLVKLENEALFAEMITPDAGEEA